MTTRQDAILLSPRISLVVDEYELQAIIQGLDLLLKDDPEWEKGGDIQGLAERLTDHADKILELKEVLK